MADGARLHRGDGGATWRMAADKLQRSSLWIRHKHAAYSVNVKPEGAVIRGVPAYGGATFTVHQRRSRRMTRILVANRQLHTRQSVDVVVGVAESACCRSECRGLMSRAGLVVNTWGS